MPKHYVILDTNVIVSSIWSNFEQGNPTFAFACFVADEFQLVYSDRMLAEYEEVLNRDSFPFSRTIVQLVLDEVRYRGLRLPTFACEPACADPDDQVFFDGVRSWDALLVTGNARHFPEDRRVLTPAQFRELFRPTFLLVA